KNGMGHGEAGWWKQQFVNADVDRNGSLSFDEFKDFLHPEDSDNEEIKKWLLTEKLERMDYDKDGKLSFVEFCDHTYDIYKNYVEYETAGRRVPKPEEKFSELDLDKDRFLTVEELIPILGYLHPGELSYAKYYASYLIHEADDNKDGNLTLEEMLNHEYIFYSTVYDDSHENSEDDLHDEL
ncbi:reticulocalbin-2, partial [Morus notabilis]